MKDVRELVASDQALEPAARSARCAAFATATACIAATQDREALFANPLKIPGRAADLTGACTALYLAEGFIKRRLPMTETELRRQSVYSMPREGFLALLAESARSRCIMVYD
jgi:hypothetical protein